MRAGEHLGPGFEAADLDEVVESFHTRGWTDGLPVTAPTEARVAAMLEAGGLGFDEAVGHVPGRGRTLTAGKAAVNAVMAGCLPPYFPIVLAGLRAVLDPKVNINALASSTGGPAPLLIASGPAAIQIGMNSKGSVFGPGNRPNATIGRAVRLVLINVFDAVPGLLDGACLGHPGKYTYCIAEDDPPEPWTTLREDLGHSRDDSVVVVMGTEGPRQISNALNPDPEAILRTVAAAIACPSNNIAGHPTGVGGQCVVILGPEHADTIRQGGWDKRRIREFLAEHTMLRRAELRRAGRLLDDERPDDELLPSVDGPDSVLVMTAGGYGGRWSSVVPTWSTTVTTRYAVAPVSP